MDAMDIQAVESKLCDVTVTAIPMITNKLSHNPPQPSLHVSLPTAPITITATSPPSLTFNSLSHSPLSLTPIDEHLSPAMITTRISSDITTPLTSMNSMPSSITNNSGLTKYAQLLAVIEEMGRDIRPTYSGSRSSAERLKRGIVHARILVRDCLLETERSAKQ